MIKINNEVLSRVTSIYDIELDIDGKKIDIEVTISTSEIYDNDFSYTITEGIDKMTDTEIDCVDEFITNKFNNK